MQSGKRKSILWNKSSCRRIQIVVPFIETENIQHICQTTRKSNNRPNFRALISSVENRCAIMQKQVMSCYHIYTFLSWMVDTRFLIFLLFIILYTYYKQSFTFLQFMCACIYFMLVGTHVQVSVWRTKVNIGTFILLLFVFWDKVSHSLHRSQAIYVAKVGLDIQILLLANTEVI